MAVVASCSTIDRSRSQYNSGYFEGILCYITGHYFRERWRAAVEALLRTALMVIKKRSTSSPKMPCSMGQSFDASEDLFHASSGRRGRRRTPPLERTKAARALRHVLDPLRAAPGGRTLPPARAPGAGSAAPGGGGRRVPRRSARVCTPPPPHRPVRQALRLAPGGAAPWPPWSGAGRPRAGPA